MSAGRFRLHWRVRRDANAVVVRVIDQPGGADEGDEGDEFRQQLAELHTLVVSDLASDHPAPKRVILDLRRLDTPPAGLGSELVRFDRFLRAARVGLVLLATGPAVLDAVRNTTFDRVPALFSGAAELNREHGADLVPAEDATTEDEGVSFTADELREMEAAGLTLGDAIRSLEADAVPE